MIVRVFRAVVHAERRAEFETFFRTKAIPLMQAQEGLVSLTAALSKETGLESSSNRFCAASHAK